MTLCASRPTFKLVSCPERCDLNTKAANSLMESLLNSFWGSEFNLSKNGKFMGSYGVKHQEHQQAHMQTKDNGTNLLPQNSCFNKTRVCLELVWTGPSQPCSSPGECNSQEDLSDLLWGRCPYLAVALQVSRWSIMIGKVWTKWPALYLGNTGARQLQPKQHTWGYEEGSKGGVWMKREVSAPKDALSRGKKKALSRRKYLE